MAKIPTTRLNSAPKEYNEIDFDQLIEDLQDIVKILNTTYPTDINNDQDRKEWFLGG
tara:strand:- start:305 stop:475 length:171 start_codon:yes stop_codon:yes gene_type:complete